MDERILEHELINNERVVNHSKYGEIVIRRPTPSLERKIAEERRKVYHRDLRDESVLTKDQVLKMLQDRGVWSSASDDRIQELTKQSGDLMLKLTALGYESVSELYEDFQELEDDLRRAFSEVEDLDNLLKRIFNTQEDLDNKDLNKLRAEATNSDMISMVDKVVELRMQYNLLSNFAEVKGELNILLGKYSLYFADTIEERSQQAEKMASIYYCMTTPEGKPLWDNFEDMWDEDPDNITWLSSQFFYFQHGIDDEYAKVLQKHGFMGRVNDTQPSSEDSQDHPQASSDGESQDNELQTSSELTTVTN